MKMGHVAWESGSRYGGASLAAGGSGAFWCRLFGRVGWKGKLGTGEEGEVFLRATGEGFSGSFLRRLQTGKLEGR